MCCFSFSASCVEPATADGCCHSCSCVKYQRVEERGALCPWVVFLGRERAGSRFFYFMSSSIASHTLTC